MPADCQADRTVSLTDMWRTIITQLGALVALGLTVVLSGDLKTTLQNPMNILLLTAAVVLTIGLAIWDLTAAYKARTLRFKGRKKDKRILTYMVNNLRPEGQVVMSSNDLSWAQSGAGKAALLDKARANSLTLLMPRETTLSRQLQSSGAQVIYYGAGDPNFRFASRFSLFREGRAGEWFAVGHADEDVHLIRRIKSNSDPTFHMSRDLIELAKRTSEA